MPSRSDARSWRRTSWSPRRADVRTSARADAPHGTVWYSGNDAGAGYIANQAADPTSELVMILDGLTSNPDVVSCVASKRPKLFTASASHSPPSWSNAMPTGSVRGSVVMTTGDVIILLP